MRQVTFIDHLIGNVVSVLLLGVLMTFFVAFWLAGDSARLLPALVLILAMAIALRSQTRIAAERKERLEEAHLRGADPVTSWADRLVSMVRSIIIAVILIGIYPFARGFLKDDVQSPPLPDPRRLTLDLPVAASLIIEPILWLLLVTPSRWRYAPFGVASGEGLSRRYPPCPSDRN